MAPIQPGPAHLILGRILEPRERLQALNTALEHLPAAPTELKRQYRRSLTGIRVPGFSRAAADAPTRTLVLVCSGCHKQMHDGWLFVSGNAEIRLTWRDRQGRVLGVDCRPDPQVREPLLPGEGGGPLPQTG